MPWPVDPIAAVTHPDPYPYYASLVAKSPLYYDSKLNMWIASGAAAVKACLTHRLCEVRPVTEKIPRVLQNTPAEMIYGHLVRMNDSPDHQKTKQQLGSRLAIEANQTIVPRARRLANLLWSRHASKGFHEGLAEFQFDFSVYVLGHLLGFPDHRLPNLALGIRDFASCLAPHSRPEQIEAGIRAAGWLLELFRESLGQTPVMKGLLADLRDAMSTLDHASLDHVAANGIGLLSQAYEATAGLIANSCLALARRPSHDLPDLIRETLVVDPPVQNTRRFLAADAVIEGCHMQRGDGILVILAAANRDSLPPVSFGSGSHQCPGADLASILALTGIEHLRTLGHDLAGLCKHYHYRPSANIRIALFHQP